MRRFFDRVCGITLLLSHPSAYNATDRMTDVVSHNRGVCQLSKRKGNGRRGGEMKVNFGGTSIIRDAYIHRYRAIIPPFPVFPSCLSYVCIPDDFIFSRATTFVLLQTNRCYADDTR